MTYVAIYVCIELVEELEASGPAGFILKSDQKLTWEVMKSYCAYSNGCGAGGHPRVVLYCTCNNNISVTSSITYQVATVMYPPFSNLESSGTSPVILPMLYYRYAC